jgi:hypothetical protein
VRIGGVEVVLITRFTWDVRHLHWGLIKRHARPDRLAALFHLAAPWVKVRETPM